jgi:hypothetical protein
LSDPIVTASRRGLHAVAELLLAGPQYRRSGTIRLEVRPGGFGTVADPDLAVVAAELVVEGRRIPLVGELRVLAEHAGLDAGAPVGVYHDGCGARVDDEVEVDAAAAGVIAGWLADGDAALRRLARDQTPVLWPEHFDLSITMGEVNYGVSPGDAHLEEPYAYVGPWQPRSGDFWNVSFGAARSMAELSNVEEMAAFFAQGRDRAAADPIRKTL